jgi:hypothetical protein
MAITPIRLLSSSLSFQSGGTRETAMRKLTLVASTEEPQAGPPQPPPDQTEAADALNLLKDYLNIADPALQQAVADLVAILARLPI